MSRFQSTLSQEGTAIERLRGHFRGLRRLARDEPELFRVMAELMLRSARDVSLAEIVRKTNEYWGSTVRTLLRVPATSGRYRRTSIRTAWPP